MLIGVCVAFISTIIAATVGSIAGYFGGWRDRTLMWVVDLLLVVPSFLLIAIVTPRTRNRATSSGSSCCWRAFSWMISSRMVRGMTMSLREREFVPAARYMGVTNRRIIVRHILPNVASILIIDTTLNVGLAILAETGLSFLGFGVQPPDVSLGTLIADGTTSVTTFPWVFLFPAGVLVLIVFCANLIGDGLRDAVDPGGGRPRAEGAASEPARGDRSDRHLPHRRRTGHRGARYELSRRSGRSASPSSANPVRASPRARWRSSGCCPNTPRYRGRSGCTATNCSGLSDEAMSPIRGKAIGTVFQDPMSALTPVYTVGDQIAEAIGVHQRDVGRGRPGPARSNCSNWSASPNRIGGPGRSRTSCPVANANGWSSRSPSPTIPTC